MLDRAVLGLDVGAWSVKAAEVRVGLRDFELVRLEEGRVPPTGLEERAEAIADFLRERGLSGDPVIAALPADQGTQRHVHFPFSDGRRIGQALPFEVEEDLPFPLQDMVLTHEWLPDPQGGADALALLVPRLAIAARLDLMRAVGVEPRLLDAEGACLANLAPFLQLDGETRAFLDVGHAKTTVCLLVGGRPALVRSIAIAGSHFTDALARDFGLMHDAAENRKHDDGIFETGSTRPVSEGIQQLLDRLVRETLRTLESVAGDPRFVPSELVLVGGSAALPGLGPFLAERLGRPCHPLRVAPGEGGRSLLAAEDAARYAHAVSLGLRGAPRARVTRLDFRRDEFRYVPDLTDLRRGLRPSLALLAACLLLWIGSLWLRVADYGRRAEALRGQLVEIHQTTFPGAPVSEEPVRAIEDRVRETRELAAHLGVTGHDLSALEILRELHARVPEGPEIAFTELQIERYGVQARGFAPSFEAVDRIRAELTKVEAFESVRLSDVVTDPRGSGKTFTLSIRMLEGT